MSGPHEFKGYPSKTSYVMSRVSSGLSSRQISDESGLPQANVSALICSAKRAPGAKTTIMHEQAARRGLTVAELRARLIKIICEKDLFEAVLDDAEGGE